MYIYLSDRKRRFYLSQTSPQNLSPQKPLSRKDLGFMQKNIANIQDSLSARLVKQQKVLYFKHIGSLIDFQVFAKKTGNRLAPQSKGLLSSRNLHAPYLLCKPKVQVQALQSKPSAVLDKQNKQGRAIIPPLYLQVWENDLNRYKTRALSLTTKSLTHLLGEFLLLATCKAITEQKQSKASKTKSKEQALLTSYSKPASFALQEAKQKQSKAKELKSTAKNSKVSKLALGDTNYKDRYSFDTQKKPAHIYAFSALSVYVQAIKTHTEKCFTDVQNKPPLYMKKIIHNPILAKQGFSVAKQGLSCFALLAELAKQKANRNDTVFPLLAKQEGFAFPCFALLRDSFAKESRSKAKQKEQSIENEREGLLRACLQMPFLAFSICKTWASAPLYANGKSLYLYSRYLYNMENLKTSIMPQVLQNQKTVSRYKYILHERKKIALLYGQLAKKDMQTLIKSAKALPGLFDDNMFTLLESRVDVLIHRAGFSTSIAGARQLIRSGMFYINGKKISSCKTRAFPGDFLALCGAFAPLALQGSKAIAKQSKLVAGLALQESKEKTIKSDVACSAKALLYSCYIRTTEQLYTLNTVISPQTSSHYKGLHKKITKEVPKDNFIVHRKTATLYQSLFLYKNLCKKESLPWSAFNFLLLLLAFCSSCSAIALQSKQKKQQVLCSARAQALKNKNQTTYKTLGLAFTAAFAFALQAEQSKASLLLAEQFRSKSKAKEARTGELAKAARLSSLLACKAKHSKAFCSAIAKQSKVKSNAKMPAFTRSIAKDFNTEKRNTWSSRLVNSCSAHILKYKAEQRKLLFVTVDTEAAFHRFMKNIQNANSASIWGQKPLHLEISHKRGCFIYMYRPQKLIFPVSLDLHAIKGSY